MMEISVGDAAGLVALGMFIGTSYTFPMQFHPLPFRAIKLICSRKHSVQFLCPTLLLFILVGIVREKETAATW